MSEQQKIPMLLAWAICLCLVVSGCRKQQQADSSTPAVIDMNRGVSLMAQYNYDAAVQAFEGALQSSPNMQDARLNLAIALFNRNRKEDLDVASKMLDEVLSKKPGHLGGTYFKAIILQHLGKAEESVPLLEKVVRSRPEDGAAWYILGLCKLRLGQSATVEFEKAVQYRPYLFSAYYQLYQAALRNDQPEKAKGYLDKFKQLRESPLGESIELPQYNQMGDLALASPVPSVKAPSLSRAVYSLGQARSLNAQTVAYGQPASAAGGLFGSNATAAVIVCSGGKAQICSTASATTTLALPLDANAAYIAASVGDWDNDGATDLCLTKTNGVELLRWNGADFTNSTAAAGIRFEAEATYSSTFADCDHDGDLDLLISGSAGARIWNNNGDLTFTNSATLRSEAMAKGARMALLADLDNDRDMDVVVIGADGQVFVFENLLLGAFGGAKPVPGVSNVVAAALDFVDSDAFPDLLLLTSNEREPLVLMPANGQGGFARSPLLAEAGASAASRGKLESFRLTDLDLDGDLDVVTSSQGVNCALLNRGGEQFAFGGQLEVRGADKLRLLACEDFTGDMVADVLGVTAGGELVLLPGVLTPPSTALAVQPTGIRSRDGRTRCPATAFGVKLTARAGLRETRRLYTGQNGGPGQSATPLVMGLDGASKVDYLMLAWPDGIAQAEIGLPAGAAHAISEVQRKVSSCPVLFTWNGKRFDFVTDFAGVGGLGYFASPGSYAPPQVLEHVKIEGAQLQPKNGQYELRITEPMEEAAYVDRLELRAIDHPTNWSVYPDERLAITGPPPTHELLVIAEPVMAVKAAGPDGKDCTDNVRSVDRVYAYSPPLDRRYIGFCKPHTLELDFGEAAGRLSRSNRVFLFIHGFIEYPYSQTVYAASQSKLAWEPIRVEAQEDNGTWTVLAPDAGAPGGMARMMTVDLSGLLKPSTRKLRLTTNLEVSYDQIFLAAHRGGASAVQSHTAQLSRASLRRVGFAREYSPDGNMPLIYDYELTDTSAPFHVLKGAYTRFGDVRELLTEFDDRYVIVGPGEEIAASFDASQLPPVPEGRARSFLLISHAYCKDMDLYTGTPLTLEPLPFKAMSNYPYAAPQKFPYTTEQQAYLREWNTRVVD